jgi:DNA polymerase III delta prime subunit
MKVSQLSRIVITLIIMLSSALSISSDKKLDELIDLIKSGQIQLKVSPNINFTAEDAKSLLTGASSMLDKMPVGDQWIKDPNTGYWVKQKGIGSLFGDMVTNALSPLRDAAGNVIRGFATDLTEWKANLYKPATYQERMAQLRKAAYYGILFAMIPTVGILMKKGADVALEVIKFRMMTPAPVILLPGSKYGRVDRLKRWWRGYKTPPMIFDASVKERLEEIEEKTKNIRAHIYEGQKITYDNLLLYGNPGTGKTLFAQILADKTDMDFLPVTAASLLQSGVEGIKYFDELLTMANKSKYGTIIFVDEADALFVDRDKLRPDSDHYKVLNHILAATGSGSNKFMLIAATNHAYVMDPAMGRRFQDRVLMPLPDVNTRKELLDIYMNEQLFDAKNRSSQFVSAARGILTNDRINNIAQETAGLSHAEIKDMVTIMGKKANATKDGIITPRNVDTAVAEAIEKKKAAERDRMELKRKEKRIQVEEEEEELVPVVA